MKNLPIIAGLFLSLAASWSAASAQQPSALFYLMETQKSVNSFEAHIDKIDVLVPTWYGVDKHGLVNGAPNPFVLKLSKQHRLPITPIISLADRKAFHDLVGDEAAKKVMIDTMLDQARLYGYAGYQFDFENIDWRDRDGLTLLAKQTAQGLHGKGLTLSVAVVPNGPGYAGRGPFAKWMWEYWRAAYDIKALAESVDLISLMTYDQHTRWTTPGPVGGMPWTLDQLKYALTLAPKEKISLGIPLYGYHWYTDNPVKPDGTEASNIAGAYFDADESIPTARQYDVTIQWDAVEHESWYYFYRDGMREWVFMPDAHSFRDRYAVLKQYGLQGFSSWVLGSEDPKVWDELPNAQR